MAPLKKNVAKENKTLSFIFVFDNHINNTVILFL